MQDPARRPTVAFDLDGTLVDSAPDLVGALNVVLGEIDLPQVDVGDARKFVGGGARLMIERALNLNGHRYHPVDVDRMMARFLAHYESHLADLTRPFPGAGEMLDALKADGATLLVCTNKLERFSVKLLEALGLARYFSVIAGADTFGARKPDPLHLVSAIDRAGGNRHKAILIGDSKTDVATARAARIPMIAVTFGYSDVPAAELGADRVIENLSDAPAAIAALVDRPAYAP